MDYSTPGSSVLHSPGVCSNSCLLNQWCYLTITSSAFTPPSPFAFTLSQHQCLLQWVNSFASGDQSIGASASATVLPMNNQGWFLGQKTAWPTAVAFVDIMVSNDTRCYLKLAERNICWWALPTCNPPSPVSSNTSISFHNLLMKNI